MTRRKPKYNQAAEAAAKEAAEPKTPTKRIAADISQQAPHNSYGGVPLYYEDTTFTCVICGTEEVWTAEQQKWWYETAKGYIFSSATRCKACRNAIRANHGGTPRRSHQDRLEAGEIGGRE